MHENNTCDAGDDLNSEYDNIFLKLFISKN